VAVLLPHDQPDKLGHDETRIMHACCVFCTGRSKTESW